MKIESEWLYRFDRLTIDKQPNGTKYAQISYGRATQVFSLEPTPGKSRATFLFIENRYNEATTFIGDSSKEPGDTDRNSLIVPLFCAIAALHPEKLLPCSFKDSSGKTFSIDKTVAEWAARMPTFDRVSDHLGRHYLRPRF